jgi:hypothetical protein
MKVIQVLDIEMRLVDSENFTSRPDKFIILSIGLDEINEIIWFESGCELCIGE